VSSTRTSKSFLVLVLIVAAAFFIYQQTNHKPSEEEATVTSVRERYAVIVNKFLSAVGRSGAIGMDTTLDSETAVTQVLKLRAEERALRKADELAEKIDNSCRKNDIISP
jgi:hypothetical protein